MARRFNFSPSSSNQIKSDSVFASVFPFRFAVWLSFCFRLSLRLSIFIDWIFSELQPEQSRCWEKVVADVVLMRPQQHSLVVVVVVVIVSAAASVAAADGAVAAVVIVVVGSILETAAAGC